MQESTTNTTTTRLAHHGHDSNNHPALPPRTAATTVRDHVRIDQIHIPVSWGGHLSGQIFSHASLHPCNLLERLVTSTNEMSSDLNSSNPMPVVCLHGYLDNSNSFEPLAFEMLKQSQDYIMIALDLPGNTNKTLKNLSDIPSTN
jgi:hypothetical protein